LTRATEGDPKSASSFDSEVFPQCGALKSLAVLQTPPTWRYSKWNLKTFVSTENRSRVAPQPILEASRATPHSTSESWSLFEAAEFFTGGFRK